MALFLSTQSDRDIVYLKAQFWSRAQDHKSPQLTTAAATLRDELLSVKLQELGRCAFPEIFVIVASGAPRLLKPKVFEVCVVGKINKKHQVGR